MSTSVPPKNIRNLGVYGCIRQAEVDDNLIPDGALTEVTNFQFDRKGASTVRLGVAAIGSTVSAGNSCIGLWNSQSGTLLSVFATSIFGSTGGAWTSTLTGLTSGQKTRFADFAGRTVMVNGSYDSIRVWRPTAFTSGYWTSSGTPINPDQFASDATVNTQTLRAKFIEVYKSRMYLAGDPTSPDRLFFSSVISAAGNITWTPSTDYVDINPSDGENITALKRFSLELLVFKPNYIYRFRTSGVDPDPLIKIGTRSQESVVEGKRGVYFHHPSGFYRYSGGYPVEISRPISDLVNNISYSNYASINGWRDSDHIYWNVFNVSITERRGVTTTWTNTVIRYTESSEVWTVYNYAWTPQRGTDFDNGSSLVQAVGLASGVVGTFNSGATDVGEPISYYMITKWYDWDSIFVEKVLNKFVGVAEQSQDMHLMIQLDGDLEWLDLGAFTDFATTFKRTAEFNRMRFKVAGVNSATPPPMFLGITTLSEDRENIPSPLIQGFK